MLLGNGQNDTTHPLHQATVGEGAAGEGEGEGSTGPTGPTGSTAAQQGNPFYNESDYTGSIPLGGRRGSDFSRRGVGGQRGSIVMGTSNRGNRESASTGSGRKGGKKTTAMQRAMQGLEDELERIDWYVGNIILHGFNGLMIY